MPDFQKTVDLKEKMTARNGETQNGRSFEMARKKLLAKKPVAIKKSKGIDEVFSDDDVKVKNEMHQIIRPSKSESDDGFFRKVTLVLFVILVLVFAYFIFFKGDRVAKNVVGEESKSGWYSVKLVNNETYYGEIKDVSADPIVIENVYYNYDQINAEKTGEVVAESTNLRLVKRGKETYGPDGTMSVVRAQVLFMEPLKEESKVLKAILNYEK